MFSNLSASVISFAIDTPSLVMVGPPHDLSIATFLPRGPRVTRTAPATISTPRFKAERTSWSKITCLAILDFLNEFYEFSKSYTQHLSRKVLGQVLVICFAHNNYL